MLLNKLKLLSHTFTLNNYTVHVFNVDIYQCPRDVAIYFVINFILYSLSCQKCGLRHICVTKVKHMFFSCCEESYNREVICSNRLYWVDPVTSKIWSASLTDGSDHQIQPLKSISGDIYGVTVMQVCNR